MRSWVCTAPGGGVASKRVGAGTGGKDPELLPTPSLTPDHFEDFTEALLHRGGSLQAPPGGWSKSAGGVGAATSKTGSTSWERMTTADGDLAVQTHGRTDTRRREEVHQGERLHCRRARAGVLRAGQTQGPRRGAESAWLVTSRPARPGTTRPRPAVAARPYPRRAVLGSGGAPGFPSRL